MVRSAWNSLCICFAYETLLSCPKRGYIVEDMAGVGSSCTVQLILTRDNTDHVMTTDRQCLLNRNKCIYSMYVFMYACMNAYAYPHNVYLLEWFKILSTVGSPNYTLWYQCLITSMYNYDMTGISSLVRERTRLPRLG